MSYINFESARVKEDLRNEKRKAREAVLEKAEADYKRRKEREQRAAERGEDKWMLPSLDAQLQPDTEKKKKHKKEKKKKKDKKHKRKKKHDSSESSDSSGTEEWVEKDAKPEPSTSTNASTERDEWMTLPALFPCTSRDQIRAKKRQDMPQDEETLKKKFLLDNPGQSDRELNPFWKDGGKGLPQMEEPLPESLNLTANSAGDHGVKWLRRALRRVQEQAKEQGRSEEAVAAERWGSLEKLRSMLSEAERRCRYKPQERGRGHGRYGGRIQGPAPRPREYEDWREDPTAEESSTAVQSESVGDKSRYRSWLGLKDPSPKHKSSSEEDDFNYDQLDDPPVIEGMELKEIQEKGKENNVTTSEKDVSDEDNEGADGKILFRSAKLRKEKSSLGKSKFEARVNAFGRKLPEMTGKSRNKQIELDDVDDDDKVFEEWKNERKEKEEDTSDDELHYDDKSNELKKSVNEKSRVQKSDVTHHEKEQGESRKNHSLSSEELRERFFQARSKGQSNKDDKEKEEKLEIKEKRREIGGGGGNKYSNNHERLIARDDSLSVRKRGFDSLNEKKKNRNEELKDRELKDEMLENQEYRDKRRDERDQGRRKESCKEGKGLSFKERRRDDEEIKERSERDEKGNSQSGNVKEKYEDIRSVRRSDGNNRTWNRDDEKDEFRESQNLRKRIGCDDQKDEQRSNRDRFTGSRRTEIPEYIRKHDVSSMQYEKAPPRRLGAFRRPDDDLSPSKTGRHDILGDSGFLRGSSGSKKWIKKEFRNPEEKLVPKETSSNVVPKPLPNIQPVQVKEREENKTPDIMMTDAEMNALGAKVLKAEILGNHTLAGKLKSQLEQAQAARKQRGNAPPVAATTNKNQEEELVILTKHDSKGFIRPIDTPAHPEPSGGRRKPQRVPTHGADGLRDRFFPDDDKYTLENMFQKEKMTTMEEVNEEFCRLASKGGNKIDSEYDLDDIFAEKLSREKAPGKLQALERNRAIQQHKRVERSLDSCIRCFDSPKMLKHLMVALGSKVYLSLPAHQSLTEGHCLLSPIHHVPCATQLDEDVWEEIITFRKALVAMFLEQDQDCIFFESAMHLRRFPHMTLECVPVPRDVGDTAPIYFKKAIMESEMEWSMNKKLVDLKGKGVRRAVPKGLPYFAVDFGNDDGFAHVIEDEKLFPENFAQEIIGGMMDLDHSLWRKQKRENFDIQRKKVIEFAGLWKKFDITKKADEDSSSTSSDSDKD